VFLRILLVLTPRLFLRFALAITYRGARGVLSYVDSVDNTGSVVIPSTPPTTLLFLARSTRVFFSVVPSWSLRSLRCTRHFPAQPSTLTHPPSTWLLLPPMPSTPTLLALTAHAMVVPHWSWRINVGTMMTPTDVPELTNRIAFCDSHLAMKRCALLWNNTVRRTPYAVPIQLVWPGAERPKGVSDRGGRVGKWNDATGTGTRHIALLQQRQWQTFVFKLRTICIKHLVPL